MKIHILADNRTTRRGCLGEHGLSVYIQRDGGDILFDTGQTDVYLKNANAMGVELNAKCIVLSHGHFDHCGGLAHFPDEKLPVIYAHEAAFNKKYYMPCGRGCQDVGIPWDIGEHPQIEKNVVRTKGKTEIMPGVFLCGDIPASRDFEGIAPGFYAQEGPEKAVDAMRDEQMLVFDGEDGLVIFLGCSHPGIISCLDHAAALFPGKRINTVLAGMHLDSAGGHKLEKTISALRELYIGRVIPLHCTGIFAICEIKRALGERCLPLCAGDEYIIDRS